MEIDIDIDLDTDVDLDIDIDLYILIYSTLSIDMMFSPKLNHNTRIILHMTTVSREGWCG